MKFYGGYEKCVETDEIVLCMQKTLRRLQVLMMKFDTTWCFLFIYIILKETF